MGAIVVSFRGRFFPVVWRVSRAALLCSVLATSLAGCAWLDAKQRALALRPTPGRPADFAGLRPGDEIFNVTVPAARPGAAAGATDQLQLWWLPNADPQAPTLLYLHGTFRSLYQSNPRKMEALRSAGFSVVAVDYRGWGESTPILPSEATIYADAQTAWSELVRRQPDPRKRVLFGHSMGSAVAVELASQRHVGTDYGALVLEAAFNRLPDVARSAGVVGIVASWFATLEFDSAAKIGKVDAPILMLHGTVDRTVPVDLGRRLRDAAPKGARWVEFEGGSHSGLDLESPKQYDDALRSVIAQLAR
jgi:uncharacterized protein